MGIIRERVDELRKKRGIQSLEDLLGHVQRYQPSLAWSSLSQIINDRRSPRLENVEAIAHALETTIAYLIGETDDPAPVLGAGEPLPEVRAWSDRLRRLEDGRCVLTMRAMEAVLAAVEAHTAEPQ